MKPILFNTEMVRAILSGRKTVTRRVMKPQPLFKTHRKFVFADDVCPKKWEDCSDIVATYTYQPGDILYVRETWKVQSALRFDANARIMFKAGGNMTTIQFENGCSQSSDRLEYDAFIDKWMQSDGWHPSIHMPKEAARLFLRVTNVRVERLQDITEDQTKAEGANWTEGRNVGFEEKLRRSSIERFTEIWNNTIKKPDRDKYGWDANPWVWVIEFERISKEEAYHEAN